MQRVLPAPPAVLAQLEAVPGVGLVLRGDVIAPLADLAGERDRGSFYRGHLCSLRSQSSVFSRRSSVVLLMTADC